jgi:hypothetical protein
MATTFLIRKSEDFVGMEDLKILDTQIASSGDSVVDALSIRVNERLSAEVGMISIFSELISILLHEKTATRAIKLQIDSLKEFIMYVVNCGTISQYLQLYINNMSFQISFWSITGKD